MNNLKKTSPLQSQSKAVVYVSTPRMYLRSGYFLVNTMLILNLTMKKEKYLKNAKKH